MMYIPGNSPAMIQRSFIYGADGLILDLEDSVPMEEKDSARILVRNMLREIDFGSCEVTVRINHLSTGYGEKDLEYIIPERPDGIRYPKCETAEDITEMDKFITKIEESNGIPIGSIKIFAILETAKGVFNAYEIASSSPRITALVFGAEDFTASMHTNRSKTGEELLFARHRIVLAARVAGVDALDTVFGDINDTEGLKKETEFIKQLGFDGKSVIHPRQIEIVHSVFTPSQSEVEKALRIVEAIKKAKERGTGVVAVDGRMVDAPVLARAKRILLLAGVNTDEE
ncbi:MAG: HpcH/HpaI aldolase/citrate lyase family protein [Synergistetes bacterium]|nr:HpcH/HpaI aldolase/citrate lyase family protein [Synergistota bacterium]